MRWIILLRFESNPVILRWGTVIEAVFLSVLYIFLLLVLIFCPGWILYIPFYSVLTKKSKIQYYFIKEKYSYELSFTLLVSDFHFGTILWFWYCIDTWPLLTTIVLPHDTFNSSLGCHFIRRNPFAPKMCPFAPQLFSAMLRLRYLF